MASEVKLGPDHPDTLKTMQTLAFCYDQYFAKPEAIALLEEMFAHAKVKLGPTNPLR